MAGQVAEWKWWVKVFAGATALGTVLGLMARADEKADAKEAAAQAKEAVALFKKTKDGKDPATRLEAIERIAAISHKSTIAAVSKYVRDPRPGVGPAAAAALGRMGKAADDKDRAGAIKGLAGGLGVKGKTNETALACCRALAALGDARGASLLLPLLKDKDAERAAGAAGALGDLKSVAAVDGLIELLKSVEPPGAKGGGGNAKAATQTEAQKARTDALQQPCHDALGKITGASHKTAAEWKKWWKANRAKLLAEAKRAEAEAKAAAKAAAKKAPPEEKPPVGEDGEEDNGR